MYKKSLNYKKIILVTIALLFLLSGGIALAQGTTYELLTPIEGFIGSTVDLGPDVDGQGNSGFARYLNNLLRLGVGLATLFAVVFIVYGGFKYVATAASSGKTAGKETIMRAIYGLFLAIGAVALLITIDTNLTSLSGIQPIRVESTTLGTGIKEVTKLEDITPDEIRATGNFGGAGWYYLAIEGGDKLVVKGNAGFFGIGDTEPYPTYSDCAENRGTGCEFIDDAAEIIFDQPRGTGARSGAGWYWKTVDDDWTSLRYELDDKEGCEDARQEVADWNLRGAIIPECILIDEGGNAASAEEIALFDAMIASDLTIRDALFDNKIITSSSDPSGDKICAFWGDTACTMVGGLPFTATDGLLDIQIGVTEQQGIETTIVITGGTETWLHSAGTKHGLGNGVVDLKTLDASGATTLTPLDLWIIKNTTSVASPFIAFGSPELGDPFQLSNGLTLEVGMPGGTTLFMYERDPDHWHVVFPDNYNQQ